MRLRAILFAAVVFAGAGASAYWLAGRATEWVEAATRDQLAAALDAAGQGWAGVDVDGLRVTLKGAAPDETARFRALEAARQVVDEGRITDATTLGAAALAPPAFALELLRNGDDISLIGLVPEAGGRDVIRGALRAAGLTDSVADMLESASDPAPDGWRDALGYGLAVLAELPRAKVSVAPGAVSVISVADSADDQAKLESKLASAAPKGVALALAISAPRPVIAPFVFDFRAANGTGTLLACSADSDAAAEAILAAARAGGLTTAGSCAVGLGAPSPDWAAAVEAGVAALGPLGGGRFAVRDLEAQLSGPEGVDPARLAKAAADLDAALPEPFRVATVAPPPVDDTATPAAAPWFDAVLLLDGNIRLTGHIRDETARAAMDGFAAALFGHDRVIDNTVLDPELPEGWPVSVLAGIEALSGLEEGRLEVGSDRVSVEGWTLDASAPDRIRDGLAAKVGAKAEVDVTFNAEAAAAAAQAARPRPEICADEINAILEAGSIRFAAGSAEIVPESAGIIAAIADVLRGCPGAEFEIAGHTDAQGPEDVNLALSEDRAAAVAAALEAEDLPLVTLSARGYGASRPVADNESPSGRAKNRRIEFTLGPVVHDEPEGAATSDGAGCIAAVDAVLADRTIEFEAGSAEIVPASAPVISAIGTALAGCPGASVEVGGHTDAQGSESGNQRLSEARAEAVLEALQAAGGTLPDLVARGYGEAEPISENDTAEGRARNRRIAFTVLASAAGSPADAAATTDAAPATDAGTSADCVARLAVVLAEGSIAFAPGSAEIDPESAPVLDAMRTVLGACPEAALEVGGYTDSEGADDGNLRLSQRRADAVVAALRSEEMPLAAMTARGYGEAHPVADNATAEGRARNRRIEIVLAGSGETANEDIGSEDGSE